MATTKNFGVGGVGEENYETALFAPTFREAPRFYNEDSQTIAPVAEGNQSVRTEGVTAALHRYAGGTIPEVVTAWQVRPFEQ